MATKIKSYFKRAFLEMIEARQRQVNRMIATGSWSHLQ
jgi:hypothetical protein